MVSEIFQAWLHTPVVLARDKNKPSEALIFPASSSRTVGASLLAYSLGLFVSVRANGNSGPMANRERRCDYPASRRAATPLVHSLSRHALARRRELPFNNDLGLATQTGILR
jgi:hypothetical protein